MWFLITYNRPLLAQRFIEAAVSTGMTTPGVMFVQGDAKGYDFPMPKGWARAISATNIGLIRGLNTCLVQHKDAPWYGLLADDLLPETEGWDCKLLEQLHPVGIVSCNDGNRPFKGGRMCGATVLDGALVRAAGFVGPPCCWHSYTDDWWELVGATFPCWNRIEDVIVRHDTPVFGDRPEDPTHEAAYGPKYARLAEDQKKYQAWVNTEGMQAMGRIAVERSRKRA